MDKRLVLWNTLQSNYDIQHSIVGPKGYLTGSASYEWCHQSVGVNMVGSGTFIQFPQNVLNERKGCVEFWAKLYYRLTDHPHTTPPTKMYLHTSTDIDEFSFGFAPGSDQFFFQMRGEDGIVGRVYAPIPLAERQLDWEQGSVHHFAVVWDYDRSLPGGQRLGIYLDGVLRSTTSVEFTSVPKLQAADFPWPTLMVGSNNGGTQNAHLTMQHLKVWNYPKMEFKISPKRCTLWCTMDETYNWYGGGDAYNRWYRYADDTNVYSNLGPDVAQVESSWGPYQVNGKFGYAFTANMVGTYWGYFGIFPMRTAIKADRGCVEFWMNYPAIDTEDEEITILGYGEAYNPGGYNGDTTLKLRKSGGNTMLLFIMGYGSTSYTLSADLTAQLASRGAGFHHYAFSWDRYGGTKKMRIFMDREEIASSYDATWGNNAQEPQGFVLRRYSATPPANSTLPQIDNLRAYNFAKDNFDDCYQEIPVCYDDPYEDVGVIDSRRSSARGTLREIMDEQRLANPVWVTVNGHVYRSLGRKDMMLDVAKHDQSAETDEYIVYSRRWSLMPKITVEMFLKFAEAFGASTETRSILALSNYWRLQFQSDDVAGNGILKLIADKIMSFNIAASFSLGAWYHVAVSMDREAMQAALWINGSMKGVSSPVKDATQDIGIFQYFPVTYVTLGRDGVNSGYSFGGNIDMVRISDYIKTDFSDVLEIAPVDIRRTQEFSNG